MIIPQIPHHVLATLPLIVAVLIVLRWGHYIFLAYALYYFWVGRGTETALCAIFATIIATINSPRTLLLWLLSTRLMA